jgi:hypothetical protein
MNSIYLGNEMLLHHTDYGTNRNSSADKKHHCRATYAKLDG